jgi:hypothetical protein
VSIRKTVIFVWTKSIPGHPIYYISKLGQWSVHIIINTLIWIPWMGLWWVAMLNRWVPAALVMQGFVDVGTMGCSSLAAHSADIHLSKDTLCHSKPLTDAFRIQDYRANPAGNTWVNIFFRCGNNCYTKLITILERINAPYCNNWQCLPNNFMHPLHFLDAEMRNRSL